MTEAEYKRSLEGVYTNPSQGIRVEDTFAQSKGGGVGLLGGFSGADGYLQDSYLKVRGQAATPLGDVKGSVSYPLSNYLTGTSYENELPNSLISASLSNKNNPLGTITAGGSQIAGDPKSLTFNAGVNGGLGSLGGNYNPASGTFNANATAKLTDNLQANASFGNNFGNNSGNIGAVYNSGNFNAGVNYTPDNGNVNGQVSYTF